MAKTHAYMIVTHVSGGRRIGRVPAGLPLPVDGSPGTTARYLAGPPRPPGRHRLGAAGTAPRYLAGPPRPPGRCRARHRRARIERRSRFAARCASLLVLLGMVGVSGWFALAGAAAVAQMIQP